MRRPGAGLVVDTRHPTPSGWSRGNGPLDFLV